MRADPASQGAIPTWVGSIVDADGNLWVLPDGQPPVLLHRDLGRGAMVTDLAWNPVRPELLVVRQEQRLDSGFTAPFDTLVRVDLASGEETVLYPDVGPQARIIGPHYGPDGSWAYAQLECCLARQILLLDHTGNSRVIDANSFLSRDAEDQLCPLLVDTRGVTLDGRLLAVVNRCSAHEPDQPRADFYLVTADLSAAQPIGTSQGLPNDYRAWLGMTPSVFAVAAVQYHGQDFASRQSSVVSIGLSDGATRVLLDPGTVRFAERGSVSPDGRIAVAAEADDGMAGKLAAVWAVDPDGSSRNLRAMPSPA